MNRPKETSQNDLEKSLDPLTCSFLKFEKQNKFYRGGWKERQNTVIQRERSSVRGDRKGKRCRERQKYRGTERESVKE